MCVYKRVADLFIRYFCFFLPFTVIVVARPIVPGYALFARKYAYAQGDIDIHMK